MAYSEQQLKFLRELKERRTRMVYFTNILDTEFTHTWDGIKHTFGPKKTYKLEFYKANLFAKYLENIIFNKEGVSVIDEEDINDVPTDERRKDLRSTIIVGDAGNSMQEVNLKEVQMEEVNLPSKLVKEEPVEEVNLQEEVSDEFKEDVIE